MSNIPMLLPSDDPRLLSMVSTVSGTGPIYYDKPLPKPTAPASNYETPSGTSSNVQQDPEVTPAGGVIPVVYGRCKLDGQIVYAKKIDSNYHLVYIFCEGEIDSFESFTIDDTDITSFGSSIVKETKTGTLVQTVCGLSGYDASWTDRLAGTAYAYIRVNVSAELSGIPRLSAVIKGLKVYDPRSAVTAYNTNPAVIWRDLMTSSRYGLGVASTKLNDTAIGAAADFCDAMIGSPSEKRYTMSYVFREGDKATALKLVMLHGLMYARRDSSGKYALSPWQYSTPAASLTDDEIIAGSFRIHGHDPSDICNKLTWRYTDTTTWEDVTNTMETASGSTFYPAEKEFDLTGCQSLSQSRRIATFLLNSFTSDLTVSFRLWNGLGLEPYDIISVTHSLGLTSKVMYVHSIRESYDGTFDLTCREIDPAWFSTDVVTEPTWPDTSLPDPTGTPDNVTSLTATEVLEQMKDGTWQIHIRASWAASAFLWAKSYEVWVSQDSGSYYLYAVTTDTSYVVKSVTELSDYTIKVITVSSFEKRSSGATINITPQGKYNPPTWESDAAITGEESGDVVFLKWYRSDYSRPAVDIDIDHYELRRGTTSDTWDTATLVAKTDALVFQDRSCPGGTWRYFLKAVDSVNGSTATAKTVDVTVVLNPNLGFLTDRDLTLAGATTTAAAILDVDNYSASPINSSYDEWDERFPGSAQWDDAIGGTVYTGWNLPAHTAGEVVTARVDLGSIISGRFTLNYTATKKGSGTASVTAKLMMSDNDADWTEYSSGTNGTPTTVSASGRYMKAKFTFSSSSLDTLYTIAEPVYVTIRADVIGESGTVTTASGTYSLTFEKSYNSIQKVSLTAKSGGTSDPITPVYDSLTTSGMTIKLFDKNNAAYDGDVMYTVEGY